MVRLSAEARTKQVELASKLYVEDVAPVKEVARRLGVSYGFAYELIKESGATLRPRGKRKLVALTGVVTPLPRGEAAGMPSGDPTVVSFSEGGAA